MEHSSERRRSPRIALNIVVTVGVEGSDGGWRLTEAYTLSVSAHGGLVEMGVKVSKGQKLLLINPKSGMKQESRIVGVSKSPSQQYAVAFEFLDPSAAFWPILSFMSDQVR
jgi:PilZ domain